MPQGQPDDNMLEEHLDTDTHNGSNSLKTPNNCLSKRSSNWSQTDNSVREGFGSLDSHNLDSESPAACRFPHSNDSDSKLPANCPFPRRVCLKNRRYFGDEFVNKFSDALISRSIVPMNRPCFS